MTDTSVIDSYLYGINWIERVESRNRHTQEDDDHLSIDRQLLRINFAMLFVDSKRWSNQRGQSHPIIEPWRDLLQSPSKEAAANA